MTTDADALLDAIITHPEEDLPRLVYADFCEEAGDTARAEFIRTQVELATLKGSHSDTDELRRKETELLKANEKAWRIPKLKGEQKFVRGFVERVWASAEEVVKLAPEISRVPIRSLRVSAIDAHIPQLAKLPFAKRLRTLNLTNNTGVARYFERLFGLGNYSNVRNLILRNVRLWGDHLEHWSRLVYMPKVTSINLSGNPIGDDGLRALAHGPAFRQLKNLSLDSDQQDMEYRIHADGYRELVDSRIFTQLESLSLNGNELGNDALDLLWDFDELPKLETLSLGNNRIHSADGDTFETLGDSDIFNGLRVLDLSGCSLEARGAHALATSPWMHRLDACILERCEFAMGAETLLLESSHARIFRLGDRDRIA